VTAYQPDQSGSAVGGSGDPGDTAGADAAGAPGQVVCRRADVRVGAMRAFTVGGNEILLVRSGEDEFHALGNQCTHAEAELDMGELLLSRCEIECPLHGGRFDFTTGAATQEPCEEPLPTYSVTVDGDDVRIDL
jgi:3-phenylpropionate/trans-cinnamate dioxygenase ferredoxin component